MRAFSWIVALAVLALSPGFTGKLARGQQEKKLSAREIFYSAPKVAAKRPASVKTARKAPPKTTASTEPETKVVAAAPAPAPKPATPAPPRESPQFVQAKIETQTPLGLRCSVMRRVGPSDLVEVDPGTVFRSGDRIRVRVETNDDGYLYIVHQGSSGNWKPLFPSPEIDGGKNFVSAGRPYDIPPGHVFTFDDQPGEEKLFVVFSRQPVADLDGLIYDLGTGAPATRPAPTKTTEPKVLLAQNLVHIQDGLVRNIRAMYARDLIIEKVDEKPPGGQSDTAVYAVNASSETDSRVVVDINLMHR